MNLVRRLRSVLPGTAVAICLVAACSPNNSENADSPPSAAQEQEPVPAEPVPTDSAAEREQPNAAENPAEPSSEGTPITPAEPIPSEQGESVESDVIPRDAPQGSQSSPANSGKPFDFSDVERLARQLASQDFEPSPDLPKAAAELNYDQFRRIQNRPGSILWADQPSDYRLVLDPRGYLFSHKVRLNIVDGETIVPVEYDETAFSFEDLPLSVEERQQLGFSGFKVQTPLNRGGKFDELISFRGASFFRALGAGSVYGASARGIAVKTASPDGEEFPFFREFWIRTPSAGDAGITVFALLDGKSVTGAFEFFVSAGPITTVDVKATIVPRRRLDNVGVVPLTSMYYFSPQDVAKVSGDYRPAVHDSQGLSFRQRNGEWVWRPLINPTELQVSVLAQDVPRGFGLMQRLRGFDAYADIEADYHLRPSVWVQPGKGWEAGQLTLVEIPTTNEYNDNIVVFWRPRDAWEAGQAHHLAYRLSWGLQSPAVPDVVSIRQSRVGRTPGGKRHLFVIDFDTSDPAVIQDVEASVSTSAGTVSNVVIRRDPDADITRLSFELDPESAQSAELRALITRAGKPVTETWIYRWRLP
ncbi:glucan biosynthesis protein [Henriciella sp. AS95]|uniref:glucan biosynthesis protein n=1 Tax=Henriciella sp. AS95 TaxID=3135782 RepID=UPI00316C1A03